MSVEQYYNRAKGTYLASPDAYVAHRLRYYADTLPIPTRTVQNVVFPGSLSHNESVGDAEILRSRQNAMERLHSLHAEVVIVTATKDRVGMLDTAYAMLDSQKGFTNWVWLVVDNNSTDGTQAHIASLNDTRVIHVPYVESTGCAYPVRNFGMYFVHAALYNHTNTTRHVLMLDSDDRLHNPYSLHELMKMTTSTVKPGRERALLHGFFFKVHETDKGVMHETIIPNDVDSSFPNIPSLQGMKARLNVISAGIFPIELLAFLRYPPEFSFEDVGFNHKLFLYALKHDMIWLAEPYPITTKVLHKESMTAMNNTIGAEPESYEKPLAEKSGVRLQIGEYLKNVYDYFVRENL